jgi:hypothetical protein
MQSKDHEEIKAALWEQAFLGCSRVSCPIGQVMAKRREEGPPAGSDPWTRALVSCGGSDH